MPSRTSSCAAKRFLTGDVFNVIIGTLYNLSSAVANREPLRNHPGIFTQLTDNVNNGWSRSALAYICFIGPDICDDIVDLHFFSS